MKKIRIRPDDFFVFRTPLLPVDEFEAWNEQAQAPLCDPDSEELASAVAADRARLRQRLAQILDRPEVLEALFIASPSLCSGLETWLDDPDSKKGQRAESALVRYFARMCVRPTPFGLFAGCSLGTLGTDSKLELVPRDQYRRTSRLDADYVYQLRRHLTATPELLPSLRCKPNSSLYQAGDRLRYVEAHQGEVRSYELVSAEADEYLRAALDRCREGADLAQIAEHLVANFPADATQEDSEEFAKELVDAQILVPDIGPTITGQEAVESMVHSLPDTAQTEPFKSALDSATRELTRIDESGLGNSPQAYWNLAESLEALPAKPKLSRLFQVDLFKPSVTASLGPELVSELVRGVELLAGLTDPVHVAELERFRDAFAARYQTGELVPLLVALDRDVGIGFGASAEDESALLNGLMVQRPPVATSVEWSASASLVQRKLFEATARNQPTIEIDAQEVEKIAAFGGRELPSSFLVSARVAARSPEALAEGDFRVHIHGVFGPSGMKLLGRFCHLDPAMARYVRQHLRAEESAHPDAVLAEIVHLPEGRMGNILHRPVLREYEIPFLGESGAPADRQIPVQDLAVTVSGGRLMLYSRRLGKRVIPRLTSAHNFTSRSLGVYRFLASLQHLDVQSSLHWSWGVHGGLEFLPRVTSGRLVLSRRCWRVDKDEIQQLDQTEPSERYRAALHLRERRNLPRTVSVRDGDNELLVDFDNVLSVDSMISLVRRRDRCELVEPFPPLDELCVAGPEGRFTSEVFVPFFSDPSTPGQPAPSPPSTVRRRFAPGSEWLYAKLYAGPEGADKALVDIVRPVVQQTMAEGATDRWFFLRYGDPDWHLRLRFHGSPKALHERVLPLLQKELDEALEDGRLWRFQLDTYEREIERYGGAQGVVLAEEVAFIDSECVLALLTAEANEALDAIDRWRWTLLGVDRLLDDFRLDTAEQSGLLDGLNRSFASEFKTDRAFQRRLAHKLRPERQRLAALLDADQGSPAPAFQIFAQRSQRLAPVVDRLLALDQAGALTQNVPDLVASFVHMYTNRILASAGREHELVIYDFLRQLKRGQEARRRQAS